MKLAACLCVVTVFALGLTDAGRRGGWGGGSSRRGGYSSGSRHKTPAPPPRTPAPPPRIPAPPPRVDTSSGHFLNAERGSSSGTTNNRGNPFAPSAPQPPPKNNGAIGFEGVGGSSSSGTSQNRGNPFAPSAPQPPSPPKTNGPIGFEGVGSSNNQGQKLGFDKVNSEVQNKPGGVHTPSAPPYQGGGPPYGPPPMYPGTHTGSSYGGVNDHPPAYPGRPVNAPPTYQGNYPPPGQTYPSQAGYGNNYPNQYNPYQSQPHPGQTFGNPNYGGNFGNTYPQQNQFGNVGHGYPTYPVNTGYYPNYGSHGLGGGSSYSTSYPSNSYGGSPFGGSYTGNPYYSPVNFGYSSNPGYNSRSSSRFGGLPIPIPIPIPIPMGGGFGSSDSYHYHLLNSLIRSKNTTAQGNSSTSVFILNNSTVAPCTTDHFQYDLLRVTVLSCTAEECIAIKITTTTNTSKVSEHSADLTMCLGNNVSVSHHGDKILPTVSNISQETETVCRDVPNNATLKLANTTSKVEELTKTAANASADTNTTTEAANTTTTEAATTTTEAANTTTTEATTDATTPTNTTEASTSTTIGTTDSPANTTVANVTRVCETSNCSWVEMCLPSIEVVDSCNLLDCPFRRTGFKPCVKVKMCRSPSTPISTFASINTTISKIDEYNRYNSVFDAANLTLISYHRPVISFNCSQNVSAPGCPPVTNNPQAPQQLCMPSNSTQVPIGSSTSPANSTSCDTSSPPPTGTTDVTTTELPTTSQPPH